jgi:hypothetical protein
LDINARRADALLSKGFNNPPDGFPAAFSLFSP